jgi:lipid II:glycine glycyltransferase (peptidoglycan interpeptide bridge formation enzyme)
VSDSSFEFIDPPRPLWDAFVAGHPQAHVMQTSGWGELKSRFGWSAERVALAASSADTISGAQILFRRLPYGLGTLAYVPKGPMMSWCDRTEAALTLEAVDQVARSRRAIAVTVEPDLPDTPENIACLGQLGFVPGAATFQPRRTLVVDIRSDDAEILAAMKSKTRYNIRLSARKGVTVRQGSAVDIGIFNELMATTGERNRFGIRSPDYYRAAFDIFDKTGLVGLFLAEYRGEPLAGLMAFTMGHTAWYFFGASSDAHRNVMAPYAVQWAAIEWAKTRGCTAYDLWGVPDEDEDTLEAEFSQRYDGLWGVYRFKRGFGGLLMRTTGAWDRVYSPLRYRLYQQALRWRSKSGDVFA